jgi:carboxyl-terminal processing protease
MRGLILDLRFNPGGLLSSAEAVSELFLERDELIVFTRGRLPENNQSYRSRARGRIYDDVPMVVMINNSSASASEIVSAAIQDHDAGLVVGKTSFGKGSVQTVFRLDQDEALKLTTARYFTPSGRSIHREVREKETGDEDVADGDVPADHPPLADEPEEREVSRFQKEKFYTDSGRVVYGGGGITPDIEIDQDYLSDFEVAVERDGALFSFAVDYASRHDDLGPDWQVDDAVFAEFGDYLAARENIDEYLGDYGLAMSDSLLAANRDFLERGMRREVARRTRGQEAAYRVAIEADTQLHEALALFEKAHTLPELLELAEKWNEEQMRQVAAEDVAVEKKETVTN